MSEIETQSVGQNQRASLMDMITQNSFKRLLQQMGSGVRTHNSLTTECIYCYLNSITDSQHALLYFTMVKVLTPLFF